MIHAAGIALLELRGEIESLQLKDEAIALGGADTRLSTNETKLAR